MSFSQGDEIWRARFSCCLEADADAFSSLMLHLDFLFFSDMHHAACS